MGDVENPMVLRQRERETDEEREERENIEALIADDAYDSRDWR